MTSDWDRPGFVQGFCEALAKRIAKLEIDCPGGHRDTTYDGRCFVPESLLVRWERIEWAAKQLVGTYPGMERLRSLSEALDS